MTTIGSYDCFFLLNPCRYQVIMVIQYEENPWSSSLVRETWENQDRWNGCVKPDDIPWLKSLGLTNGFG